MKPLGPWNMIFVGGIHGVGKGTICKRLSADHQMGHFSAGELISGARNSSWIDKTVADIGSNQSFLLNALRTKIHGPRPFLLDGHFCLLQADNRIAAIQFEIFEALRPRAVVVVVDEPATIKERLARRDGKDYDLMLLTEFQQRETEAAHAVATELEVPIRLVQSSNGGMEAEDVILAACT